jgi:hypothetical protein
VWRMRTLMVIGGILALATTGMAQASATAGTACVVGGGCYSDLQAAVDAAPSGATVHLAPGVFAGGVTIERSVRLLGAGSARTTVRGGGPVLSINRPSPAAVDVVISGLTVTGGVAHPDGFNAYGGGILTTSQSNGDPGASLTLRHVVVSGNRTNPSTTTTSFTGAVCPDGPCPYAGSFGGGINASGPLRLIDSVVSHNLAGGVASDADGGGIAVFNGPLVVDSSQITANSAAPKRIGRFAEGGGIFVGSGDLTIRNSMVSDNRTELVTSWPKAPHGQVLDMSAHGGGIQTSDGGHLVIEHTAITGNATTADDPRGEVVGFDSALLTNDSTLVMRDSTISRNTVTVRTVTSSDVGPSGTAVELDAAAQVTNTRIVDNTVDVLSPDGDAQASAGVAVYDFSDNPRLVTFDRVQITGNSAAAHSPHGSAESFGGGVFNNSLLSVNRTVVQGNHVVARAPSATAQGGGIWNGPFLSGPPVELSLTHSWIVGNGAFASGGGTAQGGGLYTTVPLTRHAVVIRHNQPDNCYGCTSSAAQSRAPSIVRTPSSVRR